MRGLLVRVLPPSRYAGLSSRLVERSVLVYSKAWGLVLSGFFEPLFYLLAFQVGLASLVGTVAGPGGQEIGFSAFVAPALLAASAMNGAVFETLSMFYKLRFEGLYDAMLATPMGTYDVALGELGWTVARSSLYTTAFLGVMAMLGLTTSPWALMMIPVAVLIAVTFGAVGMLCATMLRSSAQFDYVHLVVTPMFLFSTTFFPLSVYPPVGQVLVQLSPLYHGIELARGFSLGVLEPVLLWHFVFLAALAGVALWATTRRIGRLLLS